MRAKDYLEEKAVLKEHNKFLRFLFFLLFIAFIANASVTFYVVNNEKVVLIPLTLERPTEISGKRADDHYLAEFTRHVVYLALNYSPETIDFQVQELLKLVLPARYTEMKQNFERIAQDVKTAKVSSAFFINHIKINHNTRKILVSGFFDQWVMDRKVVTNERRSYVIDYEIVSGRLYLKDIRECKEGTCQV
ncbi:MAG: type IV conjugative transfer system protein TraE [Candidatus Aenigmatarchaeota archaeon]